MVLMLAKAGYFSGNPEVIYNSPVDLVFKTYQYEMFMRDFENTYHEINKKKGK